MAGIQKTNAARLLDNAKIAYELIPYTVDPDNLAADHVAAELGEDINQVYKTLVLYRVRNSGELRSRFKKSCKNQWK
mgnify:CR=1 FL=1